MIVQKFGGSCLDSPADIRRMVGIVKSTESEGPKVVLSAFKGVTDALIHQANLAKEGKFDLSGIEAKHVSLLRSLPSELESETAPRVMQLLRELRRKMTEVAEQRQLPAATLDGIVAFGEKLAISVASGYMAEEGLQGIPLSDAEAGIRTDGVFGNASILDESYADVRQKLSSVHVPLVAGFFGADKAGRITTLGRGASDYVATFIAAALGCKAVLFKDVDGVMTADPKVVPEAKLIPKLDYQTAMELTRYGSKVLFEKAVAPAMKARIPVEIRSFEKLNEGTTVAASGGGEAVSYVRALSLVRASGKWSVGEARSLLPKLKDVQEGNRMFVALVDRSTISIVIGRDHVEEVSSLLGSTGQQVKISVEEGVSIVALTAKRYKVSQVADAVRSADVDMINIFKAPSNITICVVVDSSQTDVTVRALHALL